jgi:tetratricopeptide (TPR) repeat protein
LINSPNRPGAARRQDDRAAFTGQSRLGLGAVTAIALLGFAVSRCTPAKAPTEASSRAPLAQKWLERAKASYSAVDLDDASDALKSALQVAPNDIEVRTWAGRVALARLDYAETVRLLQGIATTEARGLRGRAEWYAGDIDQAADELESMLQDPDAHDGWAKAIAGLARRGVGRKPFQQVGGLIAVSEMPRLPTASALLVPVEIDGDQALALVATGTAEVTLDSATRKEPSWVSLRFAGKIEVKDVPAMVQDLSGISRQMNVPVKALLGVNLLRHLNATFDYIGGQFIVRNFPPPIPANASRVPVAYVKGGGMILRSGLSSDKGAPPATLLLDSAMAFPLALDENGWKKAGTDLAKLKPVAQDAKLKQGMVPFVRLGTFDIPEVPAVFGTPIAEVEKSLDVDLDGVVGCGLLSVFRVTLTDQGRGLWLEEPPPAQDTAAPPEPAPKDAKPPEAPAHGPSGATPPAEPKSTPSPKPPGKKAPSAPRPAE